MQKTVKITFSVNSSESGMPTGHGKLEKLSELLGSYSKVIEKLSASFLITFAALAPVYVHDKL